VKLGIMQPYFFPYLGHFALIAAVDEWVVFDISQYTRKSWINRNRVLRADKGWQYISIPLRQSSIHIKISEAKIDRTAELERYVFGKLSHYNKRAPYFAQVCEIVRQAFAGVEDGSLVSLNIRGLSSVCAYLGIPFRYRICSRLGLQFPGTLQAGQWAPWIAGRLGAQAYINPAGGRALFDAADFAKENVELRFLEFAPFAYATPGYTFEPDLSILDVLMWNSQSTIVQAIRDHSSLISATELDGPVAINDNQP
jgi:hypothetical protein